MIFSSIRSKITLWSTVVSGVAAAALVLFIYFSFIRVLREETDANLTEMAGSFVTAATSEESESKSSSWALNELRETMDAFRFRDYQFIVVDNSGAVVVKSADIPLPAGPESKDGSLRDYSVNGVAYRVYDRSLRIGFQNFHLFAFRPLANRIVLENRLLETVVVSLPLAILIAALGAYLLVRRSLKPIDVMSKRADQITSQNLHERLPVANKSDELGRLANAFNELLDRLDKSFEQQRRFMADASHELRTPLAIVRGESDVALLNETRPAADYKDSLAVVNDEAKRLTKIVEDLFILARADAGGITARFAPLYVDEVLADCVRSVRTLAESRYIAIEMDVHELQINGDEDLLRRLFINLLDNAIKYNNYGGRISVKIRDRSVRIANTGPPIPEETATHIFERFYRADKARAADRESLTGGAGLGLAIAKLIAEVHGAELNYSHLGVENIFTVAF